MRLYKRYRTWWIAYRLRGERIRRSLHTRDESVARGILASMQLARTGKVERAGVDPRTHTFHTWRHTLRTRMAEGRVDMATAKEICGHRTDAMSAHYDHDQHLDAKRAALEAAV